MWFNETKVKDWWIWLLKSLVISGKSDDDDCVIQWKQEVSISQV